MKILYVIISVLLFCNVACTTTNKKETDGERKKPNILIIFPDQLRRYSAGFWSEEPYRQHVIGQPDPAVTPVLDKLAKNGVVFTQAISNYPLCSPYRGMMLSGLYPNQNGIWSNCRKDRDCQLNENATTITDVFYEAGYNTSYFGKCHWHKTEALFDKNGNYKGTTEAPGGHYVNAYDTYVPPGKSRHSIEYFYQALKDAHFDSRVYSNDPKVIEGKADGELHRPKIFSAKNEAEQIIKYLKNTHNQRNTDKPFCMLWALNPPHNPWDDANTEMDLMHKYYDTDKFKELNELVVRPNADLKLAKYARNYFANVTAVDKYIGWVIKELEEMGELENTIIVFSSDHGEMLGSHGKTGKNVFEQEAISIPFIVHYPKKVQAGISDVILGVTDVMPTVLSMAGLQNKIPVEVEGIDFSEHIYNTANTALEKPEAALLILNKSRGIHSLDYTLCVHESDEGEIAETYLYDNKTDVYQQNRIQLNKKPEIAKKMLNKLGQKLKETNDPWYLERKHKELIVYPD